MYIIRVPSESRHFHQTALFAVGFKLPLPLKELNMHVRN